MRNSIDRLIKLVRELQDEIKSLREERDYWKDRYVNEVLREALDAVLEADKNESEDLY
jgi:hypothetical protein